jgi:hypothetical protein
MVPLGRDVRERLLAHPSLYGSLTWVQVQRFLDFSRRILPEIQSSSTKLPLVLPQHVAGFLAVVLGLEKSRVQLCWTAFSDMIPMLNTTYTEQTSTDDLFRIHGHEFHIGTCSNQKFNAHVLHIN